MLTIGSYQLILGPPQRNIEVFRVLRSPKKKHFEIIPSTVHNPGLPVQVITSQTWVGSSSVSSVFFASITPSPFVPLSWLMLTKPDTPAVTSTTTQNYKTPHTENRTESLQPKKRKPSQQNDSCQLKKSLEIHSMAHTGVHYSTTNKRTTTITWVQNRISMLIELDAGTRTSVLMVTKWNRSQAIPSFHSQIKEATFERKLDHWFWG